MSDLPENFSETIQFERELALARLQGHVELAVEKFAQLGERFTLLREICEQFSDKIPAEDLRRLRVMEKRFRPIDENDDEK